MGETVNSLEKLLILFMNPPLALVFTNDDIEGKKSSKVKETKNQFIPARNVVLVK